MRKTAGISAQGAHDRDLDEATGYVFGRSTPFICPYPECGVLAQHHWGYAENLSVLLDARTYARREYVGPRLATALCEACQKETIFFDGQVIWPVESGAPPPTADLPADLLADYQEASRIHLVSPRGAAALLRLLIQKLCLALGSPEKEINAAIGRFVAEGRISPLIQKALDAVRVIGNEAVHPGTMDLRDDAATVASLFGLVNFIVEKMVTEPNEIDTIFGSLPENKLAGIAQRDRS